MLTITETARDMVRKIPEQPTHPATAGLRIFTRGDGGGPLSVKAEGKPRKGDKVYDYDGARIFISADAAAAVRDKLLDVRVDRSGRIQFLLTREVATAAA